MVVIIDSSIHDHHTPTIMTTSSSKLLPFSIVSILSAENTAKHLPISPTTSVDPSSPHCIVWTPAAVGQPPWNNNDLHKRYWSDRLAESQVQYSNVFPVTTTRRMGHPYQSRAPAKHKKPRTSFSKQQVTELETRFHDQKYLASTERASLATELEMSDAQVKTWFQNRRTKWRRQSAEDKEYDRRRMMISSSSGSGECSSSAFFARPDITL